MNITTTIGSAVFRKPWSKPPGPNAFGGGRRASVAAASLRWVQRLLHAPLLLGLLTVAAALLAFFVHLLNEQVLRGQMLREEQRAAATRTTPRAAGSLPQSNNHLLVTRQPMTRP